MTHRTITISTRHSRVLLCRRNLFFASLPQIKAIGTDMMTTCHAVILRCPDSKATSLAHFDGSFIEDGVKEMLHTVHDIATLDHSSPEWNPSKTSCFSFFRHFTHVSFCLQICWIWRYVTDAKSIFYQTNLRSASAASPLLRLDAAMKCSFVIIGVACSRNLSVDCLNLSSVNSPGYKQVLK